METAQAAADSSDSTSDRPVELEVSQTTPLLWDPSDKKVKAYKEIESACWDGRDANRTGPGKSTAVIHHRGETCNPEKKQSASRTNKSGIEDLRFKVMGESSGELLGKDLESGSDTPLP